MAIELKSELTALRRAILSMGAIVEQRLARAIAALVDHDVDAAIFVRTSDDEIDQMEVEIEEECLRVLALAQPVASDLRFILAVLRINTELERIADLAKSISKRVIDIEKHERIITPPSLTEMAYATQRLLADALGALANNDASICREIRRSDKNIDALQKAVIRWVHEEIPRHVEVTRSVIDVLSIARALERIGDMATNIAEEVIFIIEGELIRHEKVEKVRRNAG